MILTRRRPIDAEGLLLAHTIRLPEGVLAKGKPLTADAVAALTAAGVDAVPVAILDAEDVDENEAARRLGEILATPGLKCAPPASGRCLVVAECDGLARIDAAALRGLNGVTEEITVATLPAEATVRAGEAVASVKVIPFAVRRATVAHCMSRARAAPPLSMAPFCGKRAALVLTDHGGARRELPDRLRARLEAHAIEVAGIQCCRHDAESLATCLGGALADHPDLVLILGASATIHRLDVIPTAIEMAGGTVDRVGIPTDPGNLLVIAHHHGIPVLAMPGCVRSAHVNGVDLVLRRISADLPIGPEELMGCAVGGLLG